MLRFIESFGYCDEAGALQKYTVYGSFLQASMVAGRHYSGIPDGKAYRAQHTEGGMAWTRIMDAQPTWYVGFNFAPTLGNGNIAPGVFLRLESGPTTNSGELFNALTQLGVGIDAAGQLQFYPYSAINNGTNSQPGVALFHDPMPALVAQAVNGDPHWIYIEIAVTFGAHGSLVVHYDDVEVLNMSNLSIGSTGPHSLPDRISRYWLGHSSAGYAIADLYFADGQNDSAGQVQAFLGPQRGLTHFVASDQGRWQWAPNGALTGWQCLAENPSDGDATTVEGNSSEYMFESVAKVPCFGRIRGVALNVNARRKISNTTTPLSMLVRDPPGAANVTLVDLPDLANAYGIVQAPPSEYSVASSPARWTAGELSSSWWGLFASGPGTVKATQMFVETLTSLRSVPFSCGGLGNYAF